LGCKLWVTILGRRRVRSAVTGNLIDRREITEESRVNKP
jgi:hypothetical protein